MIAYLESILTHLYLAGLMIATCATYWGIRRIERRSRLSRGGRV
jgi:hypothetical protein